MEKRERIYAVKQLAKLAGVSVRTLHHYDQIGLLKPSARTPAGYRQYGEKDLLRLQQILFFRELDFSLSEIKKILSQPGFNQVAALENHRTLLRQRVQRLHRLVKTIDKTIHNLKEDKMEITDEELYEGFSKEQIAEIQREVRERYDPAIVKESQARVRQMSKAQWQAMKKDGDEIPRALATLMDSVAKPNDARVQAVIARHHAWVGQFYTVTPEIYRGLGQMYVEDERFRANYDKYRAGLADFIRAAMEYYCEHTLKK